MRVLLLHPDDSMRRGPWAGQRWDLIVDLGSSAYSAATWEDLTGCPLLRSDSFRRGVEDVKLARQTMAAGRGRLLDDEGIDWWDLASVLVVPEVASALVLRRVAAEISPSAELWSTRAGWPASALALMLARSLRTFSRGPLTRMTAPARRYAKLFRRFSAAQIKEIFLDKYDSGYAWRSRVASREAVCGGPVVLLPSAYENVSRMASAYARLLPDQSFLLIATRRSARQFDPPPNVATRNLAAYAKPNSPLPEIGAILDGWKKLQAELSAAREFEVLARAGIFNSFPKLFRDALRARDAWREVIEREPVCGVLCGDDSNLYTRLPVLLAARRKIPTVDFHHGALDGRYIFKDLPCDLYLAKTEMERDYLLRVCGLPSEKVAVGAPSTQMDAEADTDRPSTRSVVLFSEPYEAAGMRAEEVYGELLPPLCRLARAHGHGVIIKLHPFESAAERKRMVRDLLSPEDYELVTVVEGPLSNALLSQTWCGVTVESTTVLDCTNYGVPCFLCEWLAFSPFEYVQQYARFGAGGILRNLQEVAEIPGRLAAVQGAAAKQQSMWKVADPQMLTHALTGGSAAPAGAGRIS
jgi:hypothetical protein